MVLTLPGFTITDLLQEGTKSVIYRGVRTEDNRSVVIKGLRPEQCTTRNIEQLKHEYAIAQHLNLSGTLQALALEVDRGVPYLVLEDFGGRSLDQLLTNFCETPAFLTIAIKIVDTLAQIHQRRIVHKDIKPQNIIVNLNDHQIKIGDFGLAAFLPYESQIVTNSNRIEGSLPYLSPEQTGRMNRGIDQRSDLYSLGVTFYEMLTGQLPFQGQDPLEWIHCHIAKTPLAPIAINSAIPTVLSNLVMKLLAKVAEDRYQSAIGLQADLEHCLELWETTGQITPFPIAARDISDRLQIPQKLYGREAEITQLLTVFERVVTQGKPEVVLVSGYSGVGKSSLVNELHKPIVQTRGIFIRGKFDQYKRDIPYSTIVQAFQGLVRHLLTEPEERLIIWRDRIQAAVGNSGRLITDVIPEVALIIGEQPPIPVLGAAESQNRFNLVFQNFIAAFAHSDHPLAIFLDDMQWADRATLNLIQAIAIGSNLQFLCFLLAFRDNEVDLAHPLSLLLEKLRLQRIPITKIWLAPLDLACVNQLIAETLRCPLEQAEPLARLVLHKTNGNPFFINEFIKTLWQENLLTFNRLEKTWQWDIKRIEAKGFTDNVVNLMIERMQQLPIDTQQLLKLASCVGNRFDLESLAIVAEQPSAAIAAALWEVVLRGLIIVDEQTEATEKHYFFVHDRIQQAAYALIPDAQKHAVHLRIGRLLLKNLNSEQLEDQLFEVVNHLNSGSAYITDLDENRHSIQLNIWAGKRAKASNAYPPAVHFFDTASTLLSPTAWDSDYSEVFDLFTELAECEYLTGNLERAETLFQLLLSQAQTPLDQATIYRLQIRHSQVAGRFDEAFTTGLVALKLFGVTFPETDEQVKAAIKWEKQQVGVNLGDRQIADLSDAPIIQDPRLKMVISLLTSMGPPAYLSKPNLFPLVVLKALNYSLEHGNTEESCFAYSMYSMLLVSLFRDIPAGYAFSEMTIRLNQKLNDPKYKGTVLHIHGSHINVWCHHMATDLPFLEQGFLGCVEAGDITMANYNGFQASWQMIETITPLTDADFAIQKYLAFAQQSKHEAAYQTIRLQQQLIFNLQGQTHHFHTLNRADFDETRVLEILNETEFGSGIAFYHIIKLITLFTYEQYSDALQSAHEACNALEAVRSLPIEANYLLHHSLVLAALYPEASDAMQAEFRATLAQHHQQLQYWADYCPANFLHKALLVAAEIARIEGRDLTAMRFYERSIQSAHEYEFVQYEALAYELAAKFYLQRQFGAIAQTYLQEAKNAYLRWGALGKVQHLEDHYPELFPQLKPVSPQGHSSSSSATFVSSGIQLDVLSVIKASQTISSEIVLSDLLKTLMQIVIEQAGAEVGYILLLHNDQLVIEVEAKTNLTNEQISVQHFISEMGMTQFVPQSILNYVQRTQETVILDDATESSLFSEDRYIIHNRPKSVLCLPIARQSKLIGILYLENNLATGAFTQAQLSALEILSTQIAISLENAQLYQELAESREQLNLALQSGQIGVWSWDIINNRVEWDDQMYQAFGVNRDVFDCTLEAVIDCIHPDDRDYFTQALSQTLADGVEHNLEYRVVYPDGSTHHIAARGRLFFNEMGEPTRMRGIVLDITERKLAEERQLQLLREQTARAEAESANRIKDEFLAVLSHELRSPLNPILGWARLLRTQKLSEVKTAQALETIERNAKLQSELIEDLLDVSRILRGKLSLNTTPVNLVGTIQAAVETVRLAAEAKSIEIKMNLDSQIGQVLGDSNRLQQVVWNLLSNAVKFTPVGGRVEVKLEQVIGRKASVSKLESGEGDNSRLNEQERHRTQPPTLATSAFPAYAQITVTDTGKGIHADFLPHVFEYFRQADSATTRKFGGLGLGLAIVRHLVELHGGMVQADSAGEGLGAAFTVRLPLMTSHSQKDVNPPLPSLDLNLDGIHVLVVDDDHDTREFVTFVLEQAGATVAAAASAIEALERLNESKPQLLLSDIGMPEVDGYMLIRQIRALPPEQGGLTPAIALTAFAGEMNQQQALAAGFQMHLSKPVEPEHLISMIVNLIAR
ncbi:MAG TPA: AAA family ATPase [Leptolyngbyaceae cyanobacterium M33_DOE_097]|uniref:histidine kinase n=1 Tax=Oscillatoriales cyanobacterium SpSt-418 TaxID=2282169 RepID=A0A7C3KGR4_9CYAN|nr:AAA family ATPase [Leptolyngbyaceae cyanobacterium M33_DOE_097]